MLLLQYDGRVLLVQQRRDVCDDVRGGDDEVLQRGGWMSDVQHAGVLRQLDVDVPELLLLGAVGHLRREQRVPVVLDAGWVVPDDGRGVRVELLLADAAWVSEVQRRPGVPVVRGAQRPLQAAH